MDFNEKLKKYSHYKKTIKGLKKKQRKLKKEIEKEMKKENLKKIEKDFGLFILKDSKKYHYSEKVDFIKDSMNYQRQLERMN